MMQRIFIYALSGSLFLATGCVRSQQVTFYTLLPAAQDAARQAGHLPSVAVGPVTLPEVVDRPQLVVRESDNRVKIVETHRWAEPLKREIPRVIALELGALLGTSQVSSYPQNAGADALYRVQLDLQRFEAVPGQAVTVEALWVVRRSSDRAHCTGRSLVREPVQGAGYDALVAAYGRAIAKISGELAGAVRSLYQAPPTR